MLRFLILFIFPQLVLANTWWQDLWLNKDQQGSRLLKQNKNKEAAGVFKDKNWKGVAYYRDGKYQEAYDEFKGDNSAQGLYNQGNALAHLQKYQEAINAYNKSLELQKNSPDATFNKELVEKLLQQQKQQQQQQKNNSNQKQSDKDKSKDQQAGQQPNQKDQKQSGQGQNNQQQQDKDKSGQDSKNGQNNTQKNNGQNPDNKQSEQNNSGQKPDMQQNQQAGQQSGSKNQPKQNAQKPDAQKDAANNQQANPMSNDKPARTDNTKPVQIQDNVQPQTTDKTPNGQAPMTGYMRPQTPTDKEVKSALSKIPDDPGGLLRNKFLRDYQQQGGNNE